MQPVCFVDPGRTTDGTGPTRLERCRAAHVGFNVPGNWGLFSAPKSQLVTGDRGVYVLYIGKIGSVRSLNSSPRLKKIGAIFIFFIHSFQRYHSRAPILGLEKEVEDVRVAIRAELHVIRRFLCQTFHLVTGD